MAENLIAVWLDLECASGNDARPTESEIRVGAKIMPFLIAGSDLICSGFGSILKYDNSFNPSLLNGEELEDFLVLQRDFEADGGLTPMGEDRAIELRQRALDAIAAVLEELDLGRPTREMKASVVAASGSNDTASYRPGDAARHLRGDPARGITVIDVIRALAKRGFREEAENLLALVRLRISGDYLQTSALVRDGRVPGRGQRPQRLSRPRHRLPRVGGAAAGDQRHPRRARPRDVLRRRRCSRPTRRAHPLRGWARRRGQRPARGGDRRLAGLRGTAVPDARRHGLVDLLGRWSPASGRRRTSPGSCGCGTPPTPRSSGCRRRAPFGLEGRHRPPGQGDGGDPHADRLPHHNLELFSNAPITTLKHYRRSASTPRAMPTASCPSRWWCRTTARRWARATTPGGADLRDRDVAPVDGAAPEEIELIHAEGAA